MKTWNSCVLLKVKLFVQSEGIKARTVATGRGEEIKRLPASSRFLPDSSVLSCTMALTSQNLITGSYGPLHPQEFLTVPAYSAWDVTITLQGAFHA